MKELTKVQVLDALQTHKTVQKAAKALKLSYHEMQNYLRLYGIVCNHKVKEEGLTVSGEDVMKNIFMQNKPEQVEKKIIDKLFGDAERVVKGIERKLSDPNYFPRLMANTFRPKKTSK